MLKETESENEANYANGMRMNAVQRFRRAYLEILGSDLKSAWSMLKSASLRSPGQLVWEDPTAGLKDIAASGRKGQNRREEQI